MSASLDPRVNAIRTVALVGPAAAGQYISGSAAFEDVRPIIASQRVAAGRSAQVLDRGQAVGRLEHADEAVVDEFEAELAARASDQVDHDALAEDRGRVVRGIASGAAL